MSEQLDLRKYHINDDADARNFLEFVEARLPELKKVFAKHDLKVQSLISRAEFAEGRKENAEALVSETVQSVGDRMSGNRGATIQEQPSQVSRLAQLKAAGAPEPSTPAQVVDTVVNDPLNLPPAPAPGEIGTLDIDGDQKATDLSAVLAGHDPITAPEPTVSVGNNGQVVTPKETIEPTPEQVQAAQALTQAVNKETETPAPTETPVDLMAMAQQNDEEEVAAKAGTTPSEHAPDNGAQSQAKPATPQATNGKPLADKPAKAPKKKA